VAFNVLPVIAIGSICYGITAIAQMWRFGRRTEAVLWAVGVVAIGLLLPTVLELKVGTESLWAVGVLAVSKVSLFFCWVASGYFINQRVRSLTQAEGIRKLQAYLDAGLQGGNQQKSLK
jgi:hypothetical protein